MKTTRLIYVVPFDDGGIAVGIGSQSVEISELEACQLHDDLSGVSSSPSYRRRTEDIGADQIGRIWLVSCLDFADILGDDEANELLRQLDVAL